MSEEEEDIQWDCPIPVNISRISIPCPRNIYEIAKSLATSKRLVARLENERVVLFDMTGARSSKSNKKRRSVLNQFKLEEKGFKNAGIPAKIDAYYKTNKTVILLKIRLEICQITKEIRTNVRAFTRRK